MHCTASPKLEERVEDKGSSYAAEGTLAHLLAARRLRETLGVPAIDDEREMRELIEATEGITGEMKEAAEYYASIVLERYNLARIRTPDAKIYVEHKLDLTKYVPDGFGTADALIVADGMLEVIDFKYGKGVRVSAERNPQMMIYALGADEAYGFEYLVDTIKLTIVQPRIDNLSIYEMPMRELLQWGVTELRPKAQEAFNTEGRQEPGEWCKFCKVKSTCAALALSCIKTQEQHDDLRLLSPQAIADKVLPQLPVIRSWLSAVEEYTLNQALSGVEYKGYKVVEGRSVRKISDPDGMAARLATEGYTPKEIYRPQELRTITELEALIGKKRFAALSEGYITKPQGKPALVPETDKRPALNTAVTDFNGIK